MMMMKTPTVKVHVVIIMYHDHDHMITEAKFQMTVLNSVDTSEHQNALYASTIHDYGSQNSAVTTATGYRPLEFESW